MQLTQRQQNLVHCFINNDILTSEQLSARLNVSSRTIRDEIKTINAALNTPLITMCKGIGYQLNNEHPQLTQFLTHQQTQQETDNIRNTQILKYILTQDSVNYYDLSDKFFISESTLDKIISEFNQVIQKRYPKLQIRRKNNQIYIPYDENTRRLIYSCFLVQEMNEFNFELNNYRSFFTTFDLTKLKELVIRFDQEHHVFVRDFEIFAFILHIAIMLERIFDGREITEIIDYVPDNKAAYLAKKFYQQLQNEFHIELSEKEQLQLTLLFSGRISVITLDSVKQHNQFIQEIIQDIDEVYDIQLNDNQQFKDNLFIHLLDLETRIKTNSFLANPLINDIKLHSPLIYDISVFIALKIQSRYHCELIEDEIGYITLHLMNAIDRYQAIHSRKIILITTMGKAETNYIKTKLISCSDQLAIEIVHSYSLFEANACKDANVDLIVTTFPLSFKPKSPVYTCTKMMNDQDLMKIKEILFKADNQTSKLSVYFDEDLFFTHVDLDEPAKIIHFLCEKLIQKGYCNADFEEKVLNRETVAPTTYGNLFAIPHPIEKCANQNAIAVCILKNAVLWHGQKIKLVLLFSLSQKRESGFDEVFEKLVTLLNDINNVKELLKQETLTDFLKVFTKSC